MKNILIKFVKRRDLTSNLVLNLLWQIDVSNNIENSSKIFKNYGVTDKLLLDVLKEDTNRLKSEQNFLENSLEFIDSINLYSNLTVKFDTFSNMRASVSEQFTIDVSFNKFISNFDNYFEYNNYSLINPSKRIFYIINPQYYLKTDTMLISEVEKTFLNIIYNGLYLISISNDNLIDKLKLLMANYSDNVNNTLFFINLAAIFFTILFSIVLVFMFLKLFSKQDEILDYFIKVDTNCTVKMVIMCDKFLLNLNQTPTEIDSFRKFYCIISI